MTQKVIKDIQMGDVRGSVTVPSVVQYVATSVKVGKVEEGDEPSVTNVGTPQDAILDFVFAKGAYKTAVDGGYTGTQEEFNQDLGNFKELSEQAQQGAQTATEKAVQAAQSANQAQEAQASATQYAQTATEKAEEAAQSAKEAAEAAQNLKHATETTYGITRIATASEATAGTNDEAFITPLKAKKVLDTHASLKNNPHSVTKAQVGLGNVDNTSDANKPVSGPQQNALDLKTDKTYVDNKLATKADLVNGKVPDSQLPASATSAADKTLSNVSTIDPNSKVQVELNGKVSKSGDTMTGPLVIPESVSINFTDSTGKTCKISKNNKNLSALCEGKGVYLDSNIENLPGYTDGSKGYPVLVGGKNTKDYIVESYSDGEGNWYEVYASGYIRQGGKINGNGRYGVVDITFLKPFKDTNYNFGGSILWGDSGWYTTASAATQQGVTDVTGVGTHFTTTGCKVQGFSTKLWVAEGQGA